MSDETVAEDTDRPSSPRRVTRKKTSAGRKLKDAGQLQRFKEGRPELSEFEQAKQNNFRLKDEEGNAKGRGVGRYDWANIRLLFVEGEQNPDADAEWDRHHLTLREISDEYHITYQMLKTRCSSERWVELRTSYQVQMANLRMQARNKKLAGEATEFDEKSLAVAKIGQGLVQVRMMEIAAEVQPQQEVRKLAREKQKQGIKVDAWELYSAINYREIESLGRALETFQSVGRRALGTDVLRAEISGPDSGPIEHTLSIGEELQRDDPERLTAFMAAMVRSGLTPEVLEGEVVEEWDDENEQQDPPEQADTTPPNIKELISKTGEVPKPAPPKRRTVITTNKNKTKEESES